MVPTSTSAPAEFASAPSSAVVHFRRILVAFDESDQAAWALKVGAAWAAKLGGEVGLLHVMAPMPLASSGGEAEPMVGVREASALLGAAAAKVGPTIHVERLLREGDAAEQITAVAGDWKADLVVLGTHGRRGIQRLLLGSVAAGVVKQARCPVLCVGHDAGDCQARRVLVPVDRSPQSSWAVETACVLAGAMGAGVQLLHVTPFPGPLEPGYGLASEALSEALKANAEEYLNTICTDFERSHSVCRNVRQGTTANQILLAAAEWDADLIVMGAFSKHGLAGLVLGSTASSILRSSACPVLCISHDPHVKDAQPAGR